MDLIQSLICWLEIPPPHHKVPALNEIQQKIARVLPRTCSVVTVGFRVRSSVSRDYMGIAVGVHQYVLVQLFSVVVSDELRLTRAHF